MTETLPQYGPETVAEPVTVALLRLERLEARLAQVADLLTARWRDVRYQGTINTDGTGNGTIELITLDAGQEFKLTRLIVDDGVGTFAAQTTGGTVEIQVNEQRVDGGPLTSSGTPGGLPAVFTDSEGPAILCKGGDRLRVVLTGSGALSKRVFVLAQGKQRRTPLGE